MKFKEVQAECLKMLYVHWKGSEQLGENVVENTFANRVWVSKYAGKKVPTTKRRIYREKINMCSSMD